MTPNQKQIADCYQPLFDLMAAHDLTLVQSEMDDIMQAVEQVNENLTEAWRIVCDVEGCDNDATDNGMCWRDKGYWCLCSDHARMGRNGMYMPPMKQESIERENSRGENGELPY